MLRLDGPGAVCLQGGREFGDDCLPMDATVLARAGDGPVVVLAGAARPGRDYATASANAVRHYRAAGASEVLVAPDPRDDEPGCVQALAGARLVVLPGGSPASLHRSCVGTPVGHALAQVLGRGGALMGASAGAMVLTGTTVLPQRRPATAVAGLGLVPATLVVAHYDGPDDPRTAAWAGLAPAGTQVLGLPEASGVLVTADEVVRLGVRPCVEVVLSGGRVTERPVE